MYQHSCFLMMGIAEPDNRRKITGLITGRLLGVSRRWILLLPQHEVPGRHIRVQLEHSDYIYQSRLAKIDISYAMKVHQVMTTIRS